MTPYKHLLCPVDFSESSRRALEWSSRFSKSVGARLTVLHVVDTGLLSLGNLVAVPDAFNELRRRAEEAVAELKHGVHLTHAAVEIAEGVPEDVVVSAANRGDVDLLVMGTHGLSGFQKFLLGSVTEKVLHRAQVPLLSISPSVEERYAGLPDPRAILMAIDFGPESQAVVRHGTWLAEHFRAKLIALHIVRVPYVVLNESSFEPLTRMEVERLTESLVSKRREDLEALLFHRGISVGTAVDPSTEIVTVADLSRVWLLAEVPEADIPEVSQGDRARLEFPSSGRAPFEARVEFLYPTLTERTRTLRVRFVVDNSDGALPPGLYGTAEFSVGPRRALTVPRDAVVDTGLEQHVFVASGPGGFEPRTVELGVRLAERVEVRQGLSEGEEVVSSGVFLIDSESRLRASGAGSAHAGHKGGETPQPPTTTTSEHEIHRD